MPFPATRTRGRPGPTRSSCSRRSRARRRASASSRARSSRRSGTRSSWHASWERSTSSRRTVSWHRDEYDALDVDFTKRGELLDEHLAIWSLLWRETPATFEGTHYAFRDVYFEPKAYRPDGPRLWFGGESLHPRLLRRLVAYGHGFNPLGSPMQDDLDLLARALRQAGRDPAELELVGGTRGDFPDADSPADLDRALAAIPPQIERGFRTFCLKPSQFTDDAAEVGDLVRHTVAHLKSLSE
jgi:Luciferase-like monooxygenase